jgi:putative heme transporter
MSGSKVWEIPPWLRKLGLASWFLIGLVIAVGMLFSGFMAAATITMPLLFAALFGATCKPVVDRLERWHVPRWVGSLAVLIAILLVLLFIFVIVIRSVVTEGPQIYKQLNAGVDQVQQWVDKQNLDPQLVEKVRSGFQSGSSTASTGVTTALVGTLQSSIGLAFGVFVSLNALFFMLKDGRRIADWAGRHAGVPYEVARPAIAHATRSLRGYMWGSTIVGLFNGIVMFVGTLIIGVPLAGAIGLIAYLTNYIPYFGAIIGSVFAVLIALGDGGVSAAFWMLVVVLIANGPLQSIVSQFAMGSSLELPPLVILIVTLFGGVVAGVVGSVFAAPFTAIAVDIVGRIKVSGLFGDYTGQYVDEAPYSLEEVGIVPERAGPPGDHGSQTDGRSAGSSDDAGAS